MSGSGSTPTKPVLAPRIFNVFPLSRSLFQTFCLTASEQLNTQKYGLFCSLGNQYCGRKHGSS